MCGWLVSECFKFTMVVGFVGLGFSAPTLFSKVCEIDDKQGMDQKNQVLK